MKNPSFRKKLERIRWTVLGGLLLAGLAGLLFWDSPLLLPLKILAVTLHEAGHALATYAVGGHVEQIAVDRYQGGVAHCVYPASRWRTFLVASSGYLGSTVLGVLLLRLALREGRSLPLVRDGSRATLWILGSGLLLIAILFFRDVFSWVFALPTAAALLLAAWRAPDAWVRPGSVFIATFTCLYALFDLRYVLRLSFQDTGPMKTDAHILEEVLLLPAWFWGMAWSLLALLLVGWALRGTIVAREVAKK